MTIQLSTLETSEPRLLTDTYKQNSSDQSFEEKLKTEQEKLGLLFSPLVQLSSFFSSPLELTFAQDDAGKDSSTDNRAYEQAKPGQDRQSATVKQAGLERPAAVTLPSAAAAGLRDLNRQLFQDLLTKANLLAPNLAAQPQFDLAFQAGKLQPSYDLQTLIDKIIEQVNLVRNKGRTELSLTLKQEELGDIALKLTSLSGRVSVLITASAETKKLMDSQKSELETALRKADVQVDNITIEEVNKNA